MQTRFARRRAERARVLDLSTSIAETIVHDSTTLTKVQKSTRLNDSHEGMVPRVGVRSGSPSPGPAYAGGAADIVAEDDGFDWSSVPSSLDPFSELCVLKKPGRAERKRQQLESLLVRYVFPVMRKMILKRDEQITLTKNGSENHPKNPQRACTSMERGTPLRVVDFCAGSGHVGLLVAHHFGPELVEVVCVDRCPGKCEMGNERVVPHQQQNASFEFDLAVSLHSCGLLTDAILDMCVCQKSNFVLVPCCYGQICGRERNFYVNLFGLKQSFPQSELHNNHLGREDRRGTTTTTIKHEQEEGAEATSADHLVDPLARTSAATSDTDSPASVSTSSPSTSSRRPQLHDEDRAFLVANWMQRLKTSEQQKPGGDVAGRYFYAGDGAGAGGGSASGSEHQEDMLVCDPVFSQVVTCADVDVVGKKNDDVVKEGREDRNTLVGGGGAGGSCDGMAAAGWSFEETDHFRKVKTCMEACDVDRLCHVLERCDEYHTVLGSLYPLTCSPKNEVLVGVI
eukprot:g1570.t1